MLFILCVLCSFGWAAWLRPVVLVPGLAGTRLQYQFDHPPTPHELFCRNSSHGAWQEAWVSVASIVFPTSKCIMSRLQMRWNSSTKNWDDFPGVAVRFVRGISGVDYLDPSDGATRKITKYFGPLVNALTAVGYVENVTLAALGYDWRRGCASLGMWRNSLKSTVEMLVQQNGNRPALLVAHSMGCMQVAAFLNSMTVSWKQRYVASWIAAGGPFIGAPKVLRGVLSGDDLGIVTMPNSDAMILERNSGSGMFAAPFPLSFWSWPLVTAASNVYYSEDLPSLYTSLGFGAPYNFERSIFPSVYSDPGVAVTIVYGTAVNTPISFSYDNADFSDKPAVKMGDGDGTVPTLSSSFPVSRWGNVTKVPMPGVDHMDLIQNQNFFQIVLQAATQ